MQLSLPPGSPAATDQTGVEKLKAYFGLLVLMGINQLPKMWTTGQRILPFITQTASHVINLKRSHDTCTLLAMILCLLVGMKATTDSRKFSQLSLPSSKPACTTIRQIGRTVLMRLWFRLKDALATNNMFLKSLWSKVSKCGWGWTLGMATSVSLKCTQGRPTPQQRLPPTLDLLVSRAWRVSD